MSIKRLFEDIEKEIEMFPTFSSSSSSKKEHEIISKEDAEIQGQSKENTKRRRHNLWKEDGETQEQRKNGNLKESCKMFLEQLNQKQKMNVLKPISTLEHNKYYEIRKLKEGLSKFDGSRCVLVFTNDFNTFLPRFYSDKHTLPIIDFLNRNISQNKINYFFKITEENKDLSFTKMKFEIKIKE